EGGAPGQRREAPHRQHHQGVDEDPDHDRRHPVEHVGDEADDPRQARTPRSPPHTAIPIMMRLPTMALATPPPGSPTGLGRCVKKSRLSAEDPLMRRKAKIRSSGQTTTRAERNVRTLTASLFHRRTRGVTPALPAWARPRSTPAAAPAH